jgi:hypothetical protein
MQPTQVVMQQGGNATVMLSRSDTAGSLQVEVKTDSYSPAVGVNVGAVDQMVTFADGQRQAAVTVPIIAGAPNPGVVDVDLYAVPAGASVTPRPWVPLDLKIVSSDPALPPRVITAEGSPQGIVVTFSKPMNPVTASNVNNYSVSSVNENSHGTILTPIFGSSRRPTFSSKPLRLQSAQYDPATQSATLIPKRKLTVAAEFIVVQRRPAKAKAKSSHRPGDQLNVAQGLTDLPGNPINADTTPGKVKLEQTSFTQPIGSL